MPVPEGHNVFSPTEAVGSSALLLFESGTPGGVLRNLRRPLTSLPLWQ